MYQYFHKLRVRFAELEMKQGEVAKRANMAESTLTARMTGRLPWNGDEIARVAKVLDIPADQIGAFFFVDAPKEYKKKDLHQNAIFFPIMEPSRNQTGTTTEPSWNHSIV